MKAEAAIRYDKVQQGLELIKKSLDDTNRNERLCLIRNHRRNAYA
jgi:hypothetical protein